MSTKASGLGPVTKAAYRLAAWTAHRAGPLAGSKAAASLAGRRAALARWREWAGARDGVPTVWIHGASVGEALSALPVAQRLKAARPGAGVVLTHTSPSVSAVPLDPVIDRVDYLPPDEPGPMRSLLALLRPSLLLFSRGDLWPELAAAAHERGVPVGVVGACVRPDSGRLRWPVRALFTGLYRSLSYVGAVTREDGARLRRLGVRDEVLQITGDPRHDQVLERVPALAPLHPLIAWAAGRAVLVAGSTHPRDESVLLQAFGALRGNGWPARLVLCPHHADPVHCAQLAALAQRAGGAGGPAAVWQGGPLEDDPASVVVQRSGVLSDLYGLGAVAYVGGGFERPGVHAAIEPAAWAVPVIAGPRGHSADLLALLAAGGALALPSVNPWQALARAWRAWADDLPARATAGLAARRALSSGAAGETARGLLSLWEVRGEAPTG